MGKKKILVSVVVPNHGRDITKLKNSIPKKRNIELIVIDQGMERSAQRNLGIEKAKGEYILLLDSDQYISENLIEECLILARCGYETLYIPELITTPGWFGKIRAFERMFYVGSAVDVPRFCKREGCPLFNLYLHGPEDSDWGNRLPTHNRKITVNPVFHEDNIGFWDYCKKKAYYTKSMRLYKELWPDDKVLKFNYRCFWVFIEHGKWRNILRHPILFMGVIFIIFIRGVIYATGR